MKGGSVLFVALVGAPLTRASLSPEKTDLPDTLGRTIGPRSGYVDPAEGKSVVYLQTQIEDMVFWNTNISVGTPPQQMQVYFNLQGNECWLHAANSTNCGWFRDREDCDGYGGYNASKSKTAKFINQGFQVNDRGPNITGDFFKDTMTVGDTKVESMKLGVSYDGITSNSLSLGYGAKDTASVSLTQAFTDAGYIKSPAFSMWEEVMYTSGIGGRILFGGVNKAKYINPLYTLPILAAPSGQRKAFRISMTGLSINETSIAPDAFASDAVFDNQASLTHVPKSVVSDLAKSLGAEVEKIPESGQITVPCSLKSTYSNLTFEFGSAKLEIPIAHLVTDISVEEAYTRDYENCYLGIIVNQDHKDEGTVVLGTNFLNYVYSVFDLANDEVSLAHRKWDSEQDNIVEITPGKNGVPGATPAPTHEDGHEDKKDESMASTFGTSIWYSGVISMAVGYLLG